MKQQFVDRHVAPLAHSILIPNQPVVALSPRLTPPLLIEVAVPSQES